MVTKTEIDEGRAFDWGKISQGYATYRPGYPESFYAILQAVGIGTRGQDILDLGTGTGALARAFAKRCGSNPGENWSSPLSPGSLATTRLPGHRSS